MKLSRLIFSAALVWLMIFSLFVALYFVPTVQDSELLQGLIVGVGIVPFAITGTRFYYQKASGHGFKVAVIMMLIAMTLDALITVPFIEMPFTGRGHLEFFTNPLLFILLAENLLVITAYWYLKVKPGNQIAQP